MNEKILCAIIEAIEHAAPKLAGKIHPAALDAETLAPYAAYKSGKIPIRTKDGIVGFDTSFELVIFDTTMLDLVGMETDIIEQIDGANFDTKRARFTQSEDGYFPDFDIHSKSLTFKIK